jgi:hypothetical protein
MCSSGWAWVAMERQAKRVCTDVGEEALMADAAPVDFIVKVGLCNQSLIAWCRESEGCHTKPALETLCLLGKIRQPTSTAYKIEPRTRPL